MENEDDMMCQFTGCTEIDLLAAPCGACHKRFCTAHLSYDGHNCAIRRKTTPTPEAAAIMEQQPVALNHTEADDRALALRIAAGGAHVTMNSNSPPASAHVTPAPVASPATQSVPLDGPVCPICSQIVPLTSTNESLDRAINKHIEAGCPPTPATLAAIERDDRAQRNAAAGHSASAASTAHVRVAAAQSQQQPNQTTQNHLPNRLGTVTTSPTPRKNSPSAAVTKPQSLIRLSPAKAKTMQLRELTLRNDKKGSFPVSASMPGYKSILENTSRAEEEVMIFRVYFHLEQFPTSPFYMHCTNPHKVVVGKVLDAACSRAEVTNNNHSETDPEMRVYMHNLRSGLCLAPSLHVSDAVINDDVLYICRGTTLPEAIVKEVEAVKQQVLCEAGALPAKPNEPQSTGTTTNARAAGSGSPVREGPCSQSRLLGGNARRERSESDGGRQEVANRKKDCAVM